MKVLSLIILVCGIKAVTLKADGSGPLSQIPEAKEAGGLALCAPNPCLACCGCSEGMCSGTEDPHDNDIQMANCCENGGAVCAEFTQIDA